MVALFFVGLFLSVPFRVRAEGTELRVRAVLANPSAAEETEWIALENTSSATVSAQFWSVWDTFGKTVTYTLVEAFQPGEIRVLPRTKTGITLNNDQEGVELVFAGEIRQTVPTLSNPGNDQVWIALDTGWQYISLEEWHTRQGTRNWKSVSEGAGQGPDQESDSPDGQQGPSQRAEVVLNLISPCTSPEWIELKAHTSGTAAQIRVEDSSGVLVRQEELEFVAGETRRIEWAGAKLSNSGEWVRVVLPSTEELFTYPACSGTLPYHFSEGKWTQSEIRSGAEKTSMAEATESAESATSAGSVGAGGNTPGLSERNFHAPTLTPLGVATMSSGFRGFFEPPVPNFESEEKAFVTWKKRALFGSLALIGGGSVAILLTFPSLVAWYNEHKDPW